MGLTLGEYDALPGTPDWVDLDNPTLSKCEVIAWYRLSRRIPTLMAEAANKKARKR